MVRKIQIVYAILLTEQGYWHFYIAHVHAQIDEAGVV